MFVAADVHYLACGGACAAAVIAANAAFSHLVADRVRLVPDVEPYQPGQFYLRELPLLRAVLDGLSEMVFADVTSGPLAHMPSGVFAANAAWLSIAAMAHNLVRAAGALASLPFARARAATIRRDLIAVAARIARRGRGHLTLHLPDGWHREHEWLNLLAAACGPPAAAA